MEHTTDFGKGGLLSEASGDYYIPHLRFTTCGQGGGRGQSFHLFSQFKKCFYFSWFFKKLFPSFSWWKFSNLVRLSSVSRIQIYQFQVFLFKKYPFQNFQWIPLPSLHLYVVSVIWGVWSCTMLYCISGNVHNLIILYQKFKHVVF